MISYFQAHDVISRNPTIPISNPRPHQQKSYVLFSLRNLNVTFSFTIINRFHHKFILLQSRPSLSQVFNRKPQSNFILILVFIHSSQGLRFNRFTSPKYPIKNTSKINTKYVHKCQSALAFCRKPVGHQRHRHYHHTHHSIRQKTSPNNLSLSSEIEYWNVTINQKNIEMRREEEAIAGGKVPTEHTCTLSQSHSYYLSLYQSLSLILSLPHYFSLAATVLTCVVVFLLVATHNSPTFTATWGTGGKGIGKSGK